MAKDPMNNPTHSDVSSEPLESSTKSGASNSRTPATSAKAHDLGEVAEQSPTTAGSPNVPASVESQESTPAHPTADTAPRTTTKKPAKKSAESPATPAHPVKGSFAGGTWIALIAGALLLIVLLVFIMQNQNQVDLVLFAWNFRFPAGIGFLLAAIGGALIMALVGGVRMFQLRRQIIKTDKHLVETVNSIRATGGEPGKETTR